MITPNSLKEVTCCSGWPSKNILRVEGACFLGERSSITFDRQIITGFYANQLATPVLVSQQAGGPKSY